MQSRSSSGFRLQNLYVFKHYGEPTWVNFKLFGMLGLTIVFIVVQGICLASKAETQQETRS